MCIRDRLEEDLRGSERLSVLFHRRQGALRQGAARWFERLGVRASSCLLYTSQWLEPQVGAVVLEALASQAGSALVFLPGQGEIERLAQWLEGRLPGDVTLAPLYGRLDLAAQQAAIEPAPAGRRKLVLTTNVAETSLTIEGISVVIDSG